LVDESLKAEIFALLSKDKSREYSASEVKGLLLDVWDILRRVLGKVEYVRLPLDLKCSDCDRELLWGTWAHFQADMKRAICTECGTKRGWSDKDRALSIVKKRELQEDIKALRKRQKIEADTLFLLQEKVELHRFGERYLALERQIHASLDSVQSYLAKVATSEEKQALSNVFRVVSETQMTQKVIQEEVEARLFLLERSERRKKHVPKVIDDDADESVKEVATS